MEIKLIRLGTAGVCIYSGLACHAWRSSVQTSLKCQLYKNHSMEHSYNETDTTR